MKNVVIYSTPTCVHCNSAKQYFKDHGVEYVEHDVAADIEKRKEMVEVSGQMGVPVISIDGQLVVGFDQDAIEELLAA